MTELNLFNIQRFSLHDGPGIRTTVFFKGCGLRCPWCSNPESQSSERELSHYEDKCVKCGTCIKICPQKAVSLSDGKIIVDRIKCDRCGICTEFCLHDAMKILGFNKNADEIMKIIEKDTVYYSESGGGVTFSGGEPLLQTKGIIELNRRCKEKDINTAVETTADVSERVFEEATKDIDLLLIDVKSADKDILFQTTGGILERITNNIIGAVSKGKNIIARVPVIPGFNYSMEEF
jgi:glycyl-radical enzyme activating protein